MATYVISDIHGCFEEYLALLDQIDLREDDTLYVLGDCIDRGPEPMKVLLDMMLRTNVFPLIGNHEYMAMSILPQLNTEITDASIADILTPDLLESCQNWIKDGGDVTIRDFISLSADDKQAVIDYLEEFTAYETVECEGEEYVLVHAGLEPFDPDKDPEDYSLHEMIFKRTNLDKVYFEDKWLVTGHIPTITQKGNTGQVIRKNGHISIDCGCVQGYNLAAVCLETGEEFYEPRHID